jgi:glutaminyl-peptide cyclotransferase
MRGARARLALVLSTALVACSPGDGRAGAAATSAPPARDGAGGEGAGGLELRVLAEYPHDRGAYTQGLLWHGGVLYESVGRYGVSALRQVELESGRLLREVRLPPELFGEGLARVDRRLIQLTWQEGRALVWDLATLVPLRDFPYAGEGWGLAYDGRELWMSDGSGVLTRRDPESFAALGTLRVTHAGAPLVNLNELEWAEGALWANVWGRDVVARIDPGSGAVTALVEASGLLTPIEAANAEVLNGIAYDAERRVFYITGKLWPKLFEVVFAPRP